MATIATILGSLLPGLTSLSATGTTGMIVSGIIAALAVFVGIAIAWTKNAAQTTANQTTQQQQQAGTPTSAQQAQSALDNGKANLPTPPSDAGKLPLPPAA